MKRWMLTGPLLAELWGRLLLWHTGESDVLSWGRGVVYRQKKKGGGERVASAQCEVHLKMATAEPAWGRPNHRKSYAMLCGWATWGRFFCFLRGSVTAGAQWLASVTTQVVWQAKQIKFGFIQVYSSAPDLLFLTWLIFVNIFWLLCSNCLFVNTGDGVKQNVIRIGCGDSWYFVYISFLVPTFVLFLPFVTLLWCWMCHLCGQLLYPCNLPFFVSVRSCSCLTHELDLSALDVCRVAKTELPNYFWDQGLEIQCNHYQK